MDRPVAVAPLRVEVAQPAYAGVRPCGRIAELAFRDEAGALVVLAIPHQALSMLLMTLPRLIETSLRQRTGDASIRHVYPAGDWRVEAAAGDAALLLTLATPDGFSVSFRLACEDAQQLGAVLSEAAPAVVSSAQTPPLRH
jgi:hypothetical protein